MSYTNTDWLRDNLIEDDDATSLVQRMIDDRRCILRTADVEALVVFAQRHGVGDPQDNDNWGRGEGNDNALLAISNWEKERIEWQP